jgi:type I site-specific restriction endonuclease
MRPYQVDANAAIEQAIGEGKRKLLITMATAPARRS